MTKRVLLTVLATVVLFAGACNNSGKDECPVPGPSPGDCNWNTETCTWDCVEPDPDPAPDPEPPKCEGVVVNDECVLAKHYFKLWNDMKDEKFGRKPHAQASYLNAIHSVDTELIWDGIRNPQAALSCNAVWPYNGVSNTEARKTIDDSMAALKKLRRFIHLVGKTKPKRIEVKGGNWTEDNRHGFEGRSNVRKKFFNDFWNDTLLPLHETVAKLNGVKDAAKDVCVRGMVK
ncbi:MAG: hypothetical protein ACXABY_33095 [Candidatus Thorarchaeota archaeon]